MFGKNNKEIASGEIKAFGADSFNLEYNKADKTGGGRISVVNGELVKNARATHVDIADAVSICEKSTDRSNNIPGFYTGALRWDANNNITGGSGVLATLDAMGNFCGAMAWTKADTKGTWLRLSD